MVVTGLNTFHGYQVPTVRFEGLACFVGNVVRNVIGNRTFFRGSPNSVDIDEDVVVMINHEAHAVDHFLGDIAQVEPTAHVNLRCGPRYGDKSLRIP